MNKVILIGNLAADPEHRTTNSGVSNCTFRLAVQRRFANAQGVREADFFSCVAWRQTADFIYKHFIKGNKIAVEGSLQTRSYDAQDGSKRYVTEVIVDNAEFCAPRQGGEMRPASDEVTAEAQRVFGEANVSEGIDDDELPF